VDRFSKQPPLSEIDTTSHAPLGRTLMIQGTGSHVGKSILVAAFCRLFARRGYRVSPFKAQNMALNSFVTRDGHEIGRSTAFQARAAGTEPCVEMNPVLLKPSSETGSQVIIFGTPVRHMDVHEYHAYQPVAVDTVTRALHTLRERFDIVVMEGAGSPAEINLRDRDIANMRAATIGNAPVILVGDIERGGVFASLYGTLALLRSDERARVKGLLINKFRGDASLLDSGLAFLETECGVPVLGVLPFLRDLVVEEEDSLSLPPSRPPNAAGGADIAVLRLPHLSNFTDFDPLARQDGLRVRYVEDTAHWGAPDLVIVPGTKSTVSDLEWLRRRGLADALVHHAAQGGRVLGICGGFQMLGEVIEDPERVESRQASVPGLGLLGVQTRFQPAKQRRQVEGIGCGGWLDGATLIGYEIHQGQTVRRAGIAPFVRLSRWDETQERDGEQEWDGAMSADAQVAGTYLHGFFDAPSCQMALRAFLGLGAAVAESIAPAEAAFERLADWLEQNLDISRVLAMAGLEKENTRMILQDAGTAQPHG